MVEIDGQTIYFKRLVMKTTFTYDSWLWRVIRWFSKDLLRFSKDHTIISVDALGFGAHLSQWIFIILFQLMQICIIN